MNDHLLARQARRHAAVFVCLLAGFLLLGPTSEGLQAEPDTAVLLALGLAAAAFIMARRRD